MSQKSVPASAHPLISLALPLLSDAEEHHTDTDHDEGDDDHRDVMIGAGVSQLRGRASKGLTHDRNRRNESHLRDGGCGGRSRCGRSRGRRSRGGGRYRSRCGRSRGCGRSLAPKSGYFDEPRVHLRVAIVPSQLEADSGGIDLAVASLNTDGSGGSTWLQTNDLARSDVAEPDEHIHSTLIVVGEARLELHDVIHADRRSALCSLPRTGNRCEDHRGDRAEHGRKQQFLHVTIPWGRPT